MTNKKLKQLDINSKQIDILALLLLIAIRVRCLFRLADLLIAYVILPYVFLCHDSKKEENVIHGSSHSRRGKIRNKRRERNDTAVYRVTHNGFYLSLD